MCHYSSGPSDRLTGTRRPSPSPVPVPVSTLTLFPNGGVDVLFLPLWRGVWRSGFPHVHLWGVAEQDWCGRRARRTMGNSCKETFRRGLQVHKHKVSTFLSVCHTCWQPDWRREKPGFTSLVLPVSSPHCVRFFTEVP